MIEIKVQSAPETEPGRYPKTLTITMGDLADESFVAIAFEMARLFTVGPAKEFSREAAYRLMMAQKESVASMSSRDLLGAFMKEAEAPHG